MAENYTNRKVTITITYGDLEKIAVIVNKDVDSEGHAIPIKFSVIVEPFKGCMKLSREEINTLRDMLNEIYRQGDL